ncbi:mobile mystery protein A [Saccharospirillum sp.]|uniref:mobile mystery protein A n=1 Tax=Saccharospirillum sp. TaxID=2033801 RepID=UPI0034A03BC2
MTIEQLDRSLEGLAAGERVPHFKNGWIKTIRTALGISTQTLGDRIGVSQPQISKLENSEAHTAITLRSLKKAAEGLDCELVYYLVPKQKTLAKTLEAQALMKAKREVKSVNTHMALEGQGLDPVNEARMVDAVVKELLYELPRDFWEE